MLIFKDKLNNMRYITSKTLKEKLITLTGKEFDEENTDKYDNVLLINFFERIGLDAPKILDYDKIQDLIISKINDSDIEDFLPLFNMERVHFLAIIYLLSEDLISPDEIKNIIYMPFYSRTEYLLRYLSRETTETLKIDTILNKFFDAIKDTSVNKYKDEETYLDSVLEIPDRGKSLENSEEIFEMVNNGVLDDYFSPYEKGLLMVDPDGRRYYNIGVFMQGYLNIELPKIVGRLFRNRFSTKLKQSFGLYYDG
jgi:hypothetical protein